MTPTSCLVFLLLAAQIPASEALTNAGKEFMVVFPENIAYYHPSAHNNRIWITALHQGTQITITSPSNQDKGSKNLNAGDTWIFNATLELEKLDVPEDLSSTPYKVFSISNKTIKISSTKDIVVQAISSRKRSIQSALIVPTNKAAQKYFIPPVPDIKGTTDEGVPVVNVTERGPFRLIIINPGEDTASVTIKGGDEVTHDAMMIESGKVAQIWVNNDETPSSVEADSPVAVFFSHPCAIHHNCTCGLLHAMLPPFKNDTVRFPIPPVLAEQSSILRSDGSFRRHESFNPASAVVESAGTAILYRPGLLLTLIPEGEFGSCFVVPFIENAKNFLIIVVHKNHTEGIHISNVTLEDAEWQELKATDYVSTNLTTSSPKTFVWHSSFKMAVYFMGNKNYTWFGNPAPIVSSTPDFRGCAVNPEVIKILDDGENWQKSIRSCEEKNLTLISLSGERFQEQICRNLQGNATQQVWIGMRRSSLTGEWYWLNDNPINETNWAHGEPGAVDEGQCAAMSLSPDSKCRWKDQDCCNEIRPLCYKDPKILQI